MFVARSRLAFAVALLALASGCTTVPVGTSLPKEWRPSVNHDQRRANYIVIHHTSDDNAEDALRTLTSPLKQVSAHYLIGRDGGIVQLVDERLRAWHAGDSYWGGQRDLNSASIGIELDNNGIEPFASAQIDTLLLLLADLRARHGMPAVNVIAHGDIAPRRKNDPSPLFPWKRLADAGFGLWCEPPFASAPQGFDGLLALQAIGYDVFAPQPAIAAYRRHFVGVEDAAPLTQGDLDRLACLTAKKAANRP